MTDKSDAADRYAWSIAMKNHIHHNASRPKGTPLLTAGPTCPSCSGWMIRNGAEYRRIYGAGWSAHASYAARTARGEGA